jgi:hypothetical protein
MEINKGDSMSDYQQRNEVPVDRREETVITQQPGYAVTEQVIHDSAAEQRQRLFQITRILYTFLGGLEILLGLRFILKLIAANPNSGFGAFVYGLTGPLLAPFTGLVGTPQASGVILEITTLIAMAIYALLFWGLSAVIAIVLDRPSARSVTRSVQQHTLLPAETNTLRSTGETPDAAARLRASAEHLRSS